MTRDEVAALFEGHDSTEYQGWFITLSRGGPGGICCLSAYSRGGEMVSLEALIDLIYRCDQGAPLPVRSLPGWCWHGWPNSVGGDNRFLQHVSGVVARSLEEAREKDVLLRAQDPMFYGLHKQEGRSCE